MATNELVIAKKRTEVIASIEKTVSEYYGIDLSQNTQANAKKRQNIAMFVSKLISTQTKKDKEGNTQPAILTASPESIRECALVYVNGDFDFFRDQAYLISYGNTIQFIISKDGLVCSAKKLVPGLELFSDIVYKGDIFEYEKIGGRTIIKKHEQPLENITCKLEDIVCAYAVAWKDGVQVEANIMTMQEINNSLATAHRSITDFHKNNPKIMFGKFPLRQLCRKIIKQNTPQNILDVLKDEDYSIEVEPIEQTNKPISLDFGESNNAITKNENSTKSIDQIMKEKAELSAQEFNNDIVNHMKPCDIGETITINYSDWLPIYKPTGLYEPLKETYDRASNTVQIKRIA